KSTTCLIVNKWWPRTESNCRHGDLQSPALPTELQGQKMAVPTGIEPAISCVTGRHVNRYTTGPFFLNKNFQCTILVITVPSSTSLFEMFCPSGQLVAYSMKCRSSLHHGTFFSERQILFYDSF